MITTTFELIVVNDIFCRYEPTQSAELVQLTYFSYRTNDIDDLLGERVKVFISI